MAQPITIKKKVLTVKTMGPSQSLDGTGEPAAPAEAPAPVETPAPAPATKAKKKGTPFLVSTICALLSIVCFIVVVVFQYVSYKALKPLCYDQPGAASSSNAPAAKEEAPAAPAAPAAEAKKEEAPPAPAAEAKPDAEAKPAGAEAKPDAVEAKPAAEAKPAPELAPDGGSMPKPPPKPKTGDIAPDGGSVPPPPPPPKEAAPAKEAPKEAPAE